jgi:HemX protein
MGLTRLLVDTLGVLYALCLVLFFIDSIRPRRALNRVALILLLAVFALLTVLIVFQLDHFGYVPVYTRFDVVLLLCWLILLVALVVHRFFRIGLLLFFANLLTFFLVMFDVFARHEQIPYAHRQGDLLVLHITTAALSYVAFSFAFLFSLMYLIQEWILRKKYWNRWYFRLPSLETLDRYSYGSILTGLPLLLVAMVLGMVWSNVSMGYFLFWDPKPVATFALWLMYTVYLLFRLRSGWGGRRLAQYSLVCFIGVVINFIVVGDFSVFHHSAW